MVDKNDLQYSSSFWREKLSKNFAENLKKEDKFHLILSLIIFKSESLKQKKDVLCLEGDADSVYACFAHLESDKVAAIQVWQTSRAQIVTHHIQ
jgi:hypothetical protein